MLLRTVKNLFPEPLKSFVDESIVQHECGTGSVYLRDQSGQDRTRLRNLLLEGACSLNTGIADANYFAALRDDVRKRLAAKA
jgi:hypothetical protein